MGNQKPVLTINCAFGRELGEPGDGGETWDKEKDGSLKAELCFAMQSIVRPSAEACSANEKRINQCRYVRIDKSLSFSFHLPSPSPVIKIESVGT